MSLPLALAAHTPGRILLHSLCLLRCPRHASWHWQGIRREAAGLRLPGWGDLSLAVGLLLGMLSPTALH